MSANNQTLVKEYKGKFYIFTNVNAESWAKENVLLIKEAEGVYNTEGEAYKAALELDKATSQFGEGSEYGVQFTRLCKDDAEIILKE